MLQLVNTHEEPKKKCSIKKESDTFVIQLDHTPKEIER